MTDNGLRESILVADCGRATTRVALLDMVGGRYRFVARGEAPSTGDAPWSDITAGLVHATAKVEAITGREIIGEQEGSLVLAPAEPKGVDLFVASTSAAPAPKTVLVGLMDDVSLASARRVALSSGAAVVGVLGLGDSDSEGDQVQRLVSLEPDVFLIAGGTDGGAADPVIRLAETVSLSLLPFGNNVAPPTVIYAGNSELRTAIAEALSGAELRSVENVRRRFDLEQLGPARAELDAVCEASRRFELAGAERLKELAGGALVQTAKAFGWTVQYLGKVLGSNVIGVDVGSASVTAAVVVDGRPQLITRSDLGNGHHLPELLEQITPQQISRWLPKEIEPGDVRSFVADKALFPNSVPVTLDDLFLELAIARELIRTLLPDMLPSRSNAGGMLPPMEAILASGAVLANAPRPGLAALVLLDALQPVGICSLMLDTEGLAPALGTVARVEPLATAQVIESGAFRELGTVVVPVGQAESGDVVLRLTMIYENGSELEVEAEYGSLEVLPLAAGQRAELHLRPCRRFDVGAGPGRKSRRRVYGGALGVIVDARGRPLCLPSDPNARQTKIQQWLWDMGG